MSEHLEQVAVAQYLDLLGIFYTAVPNGGKRHITVAKKLKAEGVKAGIPDILIFTPPRRKGAEEKARNYDYRN